MKNLSLLIAAWVLLTLGPLSNEVYGQDLYINTDDGLTSTYSIEDVRRITIENPNLVVLLFNGDTYSFPLEKLSNYQYDELLNTDNSLYVINEWNINVYPNPFEDKFSLSFSLDKPSKVSYTIIDVNGKVILENNLGEQNFGKHEFFISTDKLPKGSYVIQVNKNGLSYSKKIIKN